MAIQPSISEDAAILNSRVLGYGQLNVHVASIVSMFSKENVFEKESTFEKRWEEERIPGGYG